MNAKELVEAVILKATGKKRQLQPGDAKYEKIFGIANQYILQWQSEPNVDWGSLYDPGYEIGTVSATNTYPLDLTEINKISDIPGDSVTIYVGGNSVEYVVVAPEHLKRYRGTNACAQIGENLRFAKSFDENSPEFGGRIEVPVYTRASLLKNQNSRVPVDDPMWVVLMCAADYVRNDTMLKDQYDIILAEANQVMQKMIENNGPQLSELFTSGIPGVSDI